MTVNDVFKCNLFLINFKVDDEFLCHSCSAHSSAVVVGC